MAGAPLSRCAPDGAVTITAAPRSCRASAKVRTTDEGACATTESIAGDIPTSSAWARAAVAATTTERTASESAAATLRPTAASDTRED
jgi:hypothetical protein